MVSPIINLIIAAEEISFLLLHACYVPLHHFAEGISSLEKDEEMSRSQSPLGPKLFLRRFPKN
jgi:hypothetical protein